MARRKKEQRIYKYECSLTGESFKLTTRTEKTDDLVSVRAWYEMHPESDDRPENIKKVLGELILPEDEQSSETATETEKTPE